VGNAIIIEVEDTGPGIEPEKIAEIFDAFVTTKPSGMGLGLAICRMIVGRHGGQLSVSSTNPCGTVFQIILPHSNPPVERRGGFAVGLGEPATGGAQHSTEGGGLHVLARSG
jgi:signal transduction histidine kinase